MSIDRCHVRDLPRITDVRGNLSYIEGPSLVTFDIQRVYYLYDVPGGADRGAHAHKALHQLVIALSGAFDIVLDDGKDRKSIRLDRAYKSLYICPMIWRTLNNFSSGAVCLVLASERYDESDYIRDYGDFLRAVNRQEIFE
jgi:hypothetical protein